MDTNQPRRHSLTDRTAVTCPVCTSPVSEADNHAVHAAINALDIDTFDRVAASLSDGDTAMYICQDLAHDLCTRCFVIGLAD